MGSLLVARYALLFIKVHRETEYINRLRGRTYVRTLQIIVVDTRMTLGTKCTGSMMRMRMLDDLKQHSYRC